MQQYLAAVNAGMVPPPQSGGLTVTPVGPVNNDPFGIGAMAQQGPAPAAPPPAPEPAPAPAPAGAPVDYPPAITGDLGTTGSVGEKPTNDPLAAKRGIQSVDAIKPPPPPNVEGGAPGGVPDRPFPLQAIGGTGVIPAHEVDLRGPTLQAAQANALGATDAAVHANTANTQAVARDEYAMYLDQARQAQQRQAAMEAAQAERDEELQQRAQDFDQSVKALGKIAFSPDGGWWASRSTPQKISALVSIGLGGFLQGARGGNNPGLDIISGHIEREVRAQDFAYHATLGQANAKQTAFSMAMQKYNNADAARAMTRAAALDGVQAQIAAQSALWKDADAANRANAAMAELEQQKMQQIAQGVRFILPQAVGRKFVDPRTGLVYSEQEAKAMADKLQGQEFKREEIGLNTAGDVIKEGVKAEAHRAAKANEHLVVLPNGEQVAAPSEPEAGKVRDLSAASFDVRRLVNRAKEIRGASTWRVDPGARAELESIQQQLRTSFSVAAQLGALSKDDIKIADGAVGDLTGLGSGPERHLDAYQAKVENAWRSRVKTYANAPAAATGKLPSSFTFKGK